MSLESEQIMAELYRYVLKEIKRSIDSNKENMEVLRALKSLGRKIVTRMEEDFSSAPAWLSSFQELFRE